MKRVVVIGEEEEDLVFHQCSAFIYEWLLKQAHVKEESLTDWLLYDISSSNLNIYYKAFSRHEESTSGVDWEWWILTADPYYKDKYNGYRFLVQAKKLWPNNQDNYSLLSYGNKNGFQIDLLLNEARYRNAYPLYMFYTTTQPDITEQIKNIQFIKEETLRWCDGFNNGCFLSDAGSISEILFNLPRHKIFDIEILNHSLKLSLLDKLFQDLSKSGHLLNKFNQRLIKLGGMDSQYKDGVYGIKHSGRGIPNYLKIFVERQGQDLSWLEREMKYEMGEIGGLAVIDLRE
ncbi:hypothetical protein EAI89_22555 [Eubacterium sp. am_0171]|uniref:Uncharacterized protein n=1 Tax=Faecalicatena contorta TaxID=39482 RepID=A0A174MSH2_9FIRM|nr:MULTISPECIES: DUF6615 family protein [Clostridia]MSC86586.1 hypothetical protein [Eubacterium sp. BIOML-A1]MSD08807.1 hypothetical protein [Eubacterium sp. BIOML-A2]RYT11039.1 hypothetical protein EAI89_22555 [Eubacterium sp. am_0171]CUP36675.1 Uncharacterised protein [[Eubacterium] contortum] [Faecalicatena contorta]